MTRTANEYDGDRCLVLPADYLTTPRAAAELYADQAAAVVNNLDVPAFERGWSAGRLVRLACLTALLCLIFG